MSAEIENPSRGSFEMVILVSRLKDPNSNFFFKILSLLSRFGDAGHVRKEGADAGTFAQRSLTATTT